MQAPTETISAELEQLREAFADMRETGWEEMFDLSNLVQVGGKILIVLILSWLSFRVLLLLLRRVERAVERADTTTISLHEQRVRTLSGLLRSVGHGGRVPPPGRGLTGIRAEVVALGMMNPETTSSGSDGRASTSTPTPSMIGTAEPAR